MLAIQNCIAPQEHLFFVYRAIKNKFNIFIILSYTYIFIFF